MKEKYFQKYLRRKRKLLETKLFSRYLIKRENSLVSYWRPFLKWTKEKTEDKKANNDAQGLTPER